MIHRLIAQGQQKAEVARRCRLLDVSRCGFYAARRRPARPARPGPAGGLGAQLQAAFVASGACYGSRRLRAALQAQGVTIGRYRVRTLMHRLGLKPAWRRKFLHTTDSRHDLPVADNLLDRQFSPPAPDRAWTSDITYIRTGRGWLYLAAVLDLYSRTRLGDGPEHAGRTGVHGAANGTGPAPARVRPSMSRTGICRDNAVMERFFLNLKRERVWRRDYANPAEASADITDYLVGFYNTERLHSTLGYRSPNDFERLAIAA